MVDLGLVDGLVSFELVLFLADSSFDVILFLLKLVSLGLDDLLIGLVLFF